MNKFKECPKYYACESGKNWFKKKEILIKYGYTNTWTDSKHPEY